MKTPKRGTISGWDPLENATFKKSRIFWQSLEGTKIFWGTKFKNPSQPFCATVIPLRMCKNAGQYYATWVHANVSSEAHKAKIPKFTHIWDHPPPDGREGASRLWHNILLAPQTVHFALSWRVTEIFKGELKNIIIRNVRGRWPPQQGKSDENLTTGFLGNCESYFRNSTPSKIFWGKWG